jgi:hypothetical protein
MDLRHESCRYPISDLNLVGRDSLVHCGGDSGVDARTTGIAIGCAVDLSGPGSAKTFYASPNRYLAGDRRVRGRQDWRMEYGGGWVDVAWMKSDSGDRRKVKRAANFPLQRSTRQRSASARAPPHNNTDSY